MAFDVVLMVNNSELNRMGKDLTTVATYTGVLKEETSIIDPVIKIETNLANVVLANYLSIPTFERYYFINNIRSIRNGIVEVSCHVDVLESFQAGIKLNNAIVKRSENNWNLYLNDGSLRVYQNPQVVTLSFPSGFSTHEFVLAVAGS